MSCFNIDCGEVKVPINFQTQLPNGADKMNGLISRFGLIKADCSFTDIYDVDEWTAKKDAGDIAMSPCGTIDLGTPSVATSLNECGLDEADETTFTPSFSMKKLDGTALLHVAWLCEFMENKDCLRLFFCDCNGNPILHPEWNKYLAGLSATPPSTCPGMPFTVPIVPNRTAGDNNRLTYTFGFQIKLDGEQFLAESLLPGVCAALAA